MKYHPKSISNNSIWVQKWNNLKQWWHLLNLEQEIGEKVERKVNSFHLQKWGNKKDELR